MYNPQEDNWFYWTVEFEVLFLLLVAKECLIFEDGFFRPVPLESAGIYRATTDNSYSITVFNRVNGISKTDTLISI